MQAVMDRRVFDRFPARFPVRFSHMRGEYGRDVFLRDASANGAHISARKKIYLHDSVSLEVKIPNTPAPLVMNGRVAWIVARDPQWYEAGIEFYKVNLMQMRRLFDLVDGLV